MKLSLLTWNMQGKDSKDTDKMGNKMSALKNWLFSGAVENPVICLQECGKLDEFRQLRPISPKSSVSAGAIRFSSRQVMFVVYYEAEVDNNRTNLAIVTRADLATGNVEAILPPPRQSGLRSVVGMEIAHTGGVYIYSQHAPSSNPKFASRYTRLMLPKIRKSQWIYAGDFNCEPSELDQGTGDWQQDWIVTAGSEQTQISGGKLDYVVSRNMLSSIPGNGIRWIREIPGKADNFVSDHYVQYFEVTLK